MDDPPRPTWARLSQNYTKITLRLSGLSGQELVAAPPLQPKDLPKFGPFCLGYHCTLPQCALGEQCSLNIHSTIAKYYQALDTALFLIFINILPWIACHFTQSSLKYHQTVLQFSHNFLIIVLERMSNQTASNVLPFTAL